MLTSERFMQDAPLEEVSDGGDIKVYLALALRYWWVFVVITAAAGVAGGEYPGSGCLKFIVTGRVIGAIVQFQVQLRAHIVLGTEKSHGDENQVGYPELNSARYLFKILIHFHSIDA